MKYTIMQCPICGKTFYNEYNAGGYIDHVENFSNDLARKAKGSIDCTEKNIKRYYEEIYYHGNEIREKDDVECRLNCFLSAEAVCNELKNAVAEKVKEVVEKKDKVREQFCTAVKDFMSKLTDDDFVVFENYANETNHYGGTTPIARLLEKLCDTERDSRIAKEFSVGERVICVDDLLVMLVQERKATITKISSEYPFKIKIKFDNQERECEVTASKLRKILEEKS